MKTIQKFVLHIYSLKHSQHAIYSNLERKINDILKLKLFFRSKSKQYFVPIETLIYCLRTCLFVSETDSSTQVYQFLRQEIIDSCLNSTMAYNILFYTLSLSKMHTLGLLTLFKILFLRTFSRCIHAVHDHNALSNIRDFVSLFHSQRFYQFHFLDLYSNILQFWNHLSLTIAFAASQCLCQLLSFDEDFAVLDEIRMSLLHIVQLSLESPDILQWRPIALILGTPKAIRKDYIRHFISTLISRRPKVVIDAVCQCYSTAPPDLPEMTSSAIFESSIVLQLTRVGRGWKATASCGYAPILSNILATIAMYSQSESSFDSASGRYHILYTPSVGSIFANTVLQMPIFSLYFHRSYLDNLDSMKETFLKSRQPGEIEEIEKSYKAQMGLQRMSLCAHNLAYNMIRNELMDPISISSIFNYAEYFPIVGLLSNKAFVLGGLTIWHTDLNLQAREFYEVFATLLMIYSTYSESSVIFSPNFPHLGTDSTIILNNLLNSLAFSRPSDPIPRMLWLQIKNLSEPEITAALSDDMKSSRNDLNSRLPRLSYVASLLYLFSTTFNHQLSAVDDEELLESDSTKLSSELPAIVRLIKFVLQILYWSDGNGWNPDNDLFTQQSKFGILNLQLALTRLFNKLYIRNEYG